MSGNHANTGNAKRLTIALCLTGTYLLAEVAGGIWTGSLALLSDAAHMLTDVMALVIALIAVRIGNKPADLRRTFGYRRFEILAAAFNAVVLFGVAIYILYEAAQRFKTPPDIESGWMMAIAAVGLVINIISLYVLQGGKDSSLNLKAAYLEVLSDMLGSVAVIIAGLIIRYTGWWQADPILAVMIGLWVLPRTWKLLVESTNILLEGVPESIEMQKLLDELKALPGVVDVHDMHVWAITSGENSLTVHLVVSAYPSDGVLRQQALEVVKKHNIEHANFQIETAAENGADHLNDH